MQTAATLNASNARLLVLAQDRRFDAQQRAMFRKAAKFTASEAANLSVAPANLICVGQF